MIRSHGPARRNALRAAALALAWAVADAAPASAQNWAELQNPQIAISYVEPRNSAFRPIYERLKQRQVLEQLSAFMSPLSLTRKLEVKTDQCGATTSVFVPGGGVTICYEYVAEIERLAPTARTQYGVTREAAVTGAFVRSCCMKCRVRCSTSCRSRSGAARPTPPTSLPASSCCSSVRTWR